MTFINRKVHTLGSEVTIKSGAHFTSMRFINRKVHTLWSKVTIKSVYRFYFNEIYKQKSSYPRAGSYNKVGENVLL